MCEQRPCSQKAGFDSGDLAFLRGVGAGCVSRDHALRKRDLIQEIWLFYVGWEQDV